MSVVYLDYAATTPVDPLVVAAMTKALSSPQIFANAESKTHQYGWLAEQAIESARLDLADAVGAETSDVIWTSGATESNNLAIQGLIGSLLESQQNETVVSRLHIITSAIEHKSVLQTCLAMSKHPRIDITVLQPDAHGQLSVEQVRSVITPQTVLISLMQVNNELGTINAITEIARLIVDHPAFLHVDAAQSLGKVALNFKALGADMVSLSAHKAYGPKGVGVLLANTHARRQLKPLCWGGRHELGLRPGTLATHQIVGMALSVSLAKQRFSIDYAHVSQLQQQFCEGVQQLPHVVWHAAQASQRIPHIVNLGFVGLPGELLLKALHEIAVASGSACNSVMLEPSHVLTACGVSAELAASSLRFSFGRLTTQEDIVRTLEHLRYVTNRLRG
jgi:cysteine desulfurase